MIPSRDNYFSVQLYFIYILNNELWLLIVRVVKEYEERAFPKDRLQGEVHRQLQLRLKLRLQLQGRATEIKKAFPKVTPFIFLLLAETF